MRRKFQRTKTPVYQPPMLPGIVIHKAWDDLTLEEGKAYLTQLSDRLRAKKQREQSYLDRRAARGTHTPTDEAYAQDQILEDELLTLLGSLIQELDKQKGRP